MNRLDDLKRAIVIRTICEGGSMRAASRITGISINTVTKLVCELGVACAWFQDKQLVNLPCTELQLDEAWAFVGCKEANKPLVKGQHPGDVWTWVGMCPNTKLVAGWFIGDRSADSAVEFCTDLGNRFSGHVQVTSDGHAPYRFAVRLGFKDASFAQLVKIYGTDAQGNEIVTRCEKVVRFGNPNMDKVSTSLIERQNLTLRMSLRRYARRTNAHSKKIENHCKAVALHFFSYNFMRKHETLKGRTPAMAAGVTEKVWTADDLLAMFDAYQVANHPVQRPVHYKPRKKKVVQEPTPKDQIPTPWYLNPNGEPPSQISN
jgi:hypothetical protein